MWENFAGSQCSKHFVLKLISFNNGQLQIRERAITINFVHAKGDLAAGELFTVGATIIRGAFGVKERTSGKV